MTTSCSEPPNDDKEQESDTEKCIQSLEDHLAATLPVTPTPEHPNPRVPEAGKDLLDRLETAVEEGLDRWGETDADQNPSSLAEITEQEFKEKTTTPHPVSALGGCETDESPERRQTIREEVLQDSDTENQGVEEVGSSSSSQEEIIVNPSNFDSPENRPPVTPMPGPSAGYCYQFPSTTAGGVSNSDTREEERNNNKEKPRSLPTVRKRHTITNRASHQILVHQVPVSFPVAGNLMENEESLTYIQDALDGVSEVNELPGNVIVNATLLNRMENNQYRATLIVELDSEERCNQIIKKAKNKLAQDKSFAFYITPKPRRLHTRNISYSDEEPKADSKAKKRKAKHPSEGMDKRKKNPKQHCNTSDASTPKRPRVEPENDGPSKRHKVEPENAGPTNAVSTPLPSTSRINPDAPVDVLAKLVRGVTGIVPVPRIDAPRPQKSTLDTSNLDMAMTVEVENDMYTGLDNTTVLIPEEQDSDESVRRECQEKEMELIQRIEAFRRRAQNWSEDLRLTMRGRPVPQYPSTDLRQTMRQKSGPTDLRNSKLNRDKDIRGMMRPKRRTSSVPPNPRTANRESLTTDKAIDYLEQTIIKRESFLDTGIDERRQLISRLKRRLQFQARNKVVVEEESDTSNSSDSNKEGEVEPSEDELTNVRFSQESCPVNTTVM